MERFYCITMKDSKGRQLYLEMRNGKPAWTFKAKDACGWDTKEQALDFAKKWFKAFNSWQVQALDCK